MKRIATALLALAVTAALPLAAQEVPPAEAAAEAEAAAKAAAEAAALAENDAYLKAADAALEAEAAAQAAEEAVEASESADVTMTAEAEAEAAEAAASEAGEAAQAAAGAAEQAAEEAADAAEVQAEVEAEAEADADSAQMSADMQAMMQAWEEASTPGPQHAQLAEHFVGTWDATTSIWMDPSAPPMTSTGREVSTAIYGGRHIVSDFSGSMMGMPFTGRAVTSYDNTTGKYVVSFMDDMSTGHYFAEGEYDADTQTYTFTSEMPDLMAPDTSIPIRQTIQVIDPDHHVMKWFETRDGEEQMTMQIEYVRAE